MTIYNRSFLTVSGRQRRARKLEGPSQAYRDVSDRHRVSLDRRRHRRVLILQDGIGGPKDASVAQIVRAGASGGGRALEIRDEVLRRRGGEGQGGCGGEG